MESTIQQMTPSRRNYDRNLWTRLREWKERYSILWGPLAALAIAAGFGFRTPKQTTDKLQLQIDTLKTEIQTVQRQTSNTSLRVEMLIRLTCASTTLNKRDAALLGLDCTAVLPSGGASK